VRNDYTIPLDAELYQIERQAVVSGLRKANVRVEKRLDGSIAVRFGERYLPVSRCGATAKTKAPPAKSAAPRRSPNRLRGSEWNKNFDLKKGPKIMAGGLSAGAETRGCVFKAWRNLSLRCVSHLPTNLARLTAFRPGPDQVLRRAGRKHAYSSSRRVPAGYSSIGLVATIARLRFTGTRTLTCTFHKPRQKGTFLLCQQGDISTLP